MARSWRTARGTAATLVVAFVVAGCGSSSSSVPSSTHSQPSSQTSATATALGSEVSSIGQTLQTAVDAHVFPGAVVVVRRGGQTRTVAVGRADVAQSIPMTPGDRFRIASVTKSMVAAVALQLVAQGRLSLSDTVEKWEPGLLARGGDITVADLLGQTSGLPAFQSTKAFARMRGDPSPQDLVALVARAPLMFEPGSRSWYSNTNYLTLGLIVAKVSHEPLAALLQQRIFGPLGLHSARLAPTGANTAPLAHGYDHGKDVTPDLTWLWAAGGVVASAGDVERFYDGLFAGKIVPGPLLRQMRSQRPETNHTLPFSGYGLGIATLPTSCGQAYGHSGEAPGFIVHAWTSQDGRRSVVMAVNATLTTSVDDYVGAVLEQALCGP
jgi:D-alanyl-D-alanine carboxypeptidase